MPSDVRLDLSDKAATPRSLVLNTWFLSFLQPGRAVGGLPNDFLTRAPGALLLYDDIVCDGEAFESEAIAADRGGWISSALFVRLKKAGVVSLRPFRELIGPILEAIPENQVLKNEALEIMDRTVRVLKQSAAGGSNQIRKLPPELAIINAHLFNYRLPVRGLKYNWQENLLKVIPPVLSSGDARNSPKTSAFRNIGQNLLKYNGVNAQLIPPLTKQGREASRRVHLIERNGLLRCVCGDSDFTLEHARDFRFGKEFRELDCVIDDEKRRSEAFHNLDIVLRIRDKTKALRRAMQEQVGLVLDGKKTASAVKSEIHRQLTEIASYAPSAKSFMKQVGWDIAAPTAEVAAEVLKELGKSIPGLGLGIAAADIAKIAKEVRETNARRLENPLGHFVAIAAAISQGRY